MNAPDPNTEPGHVGVCPYCREIVDEPIMQHCDHCPEFKRWLPDVKSPYECRGEWVKYVNLSDNKLHNSRDY